MTSRPATSRSLLQQVSIVEQMRPTRSGHNASTWGERLQYYSLEQTANILQCFILQLHERHSRTRDIQALGYAIFFSRVVVELLGGKVRTPPELTSNLCLLLWTRYGEVGSISDLEEALAIAKKGVSTTPASHPIYTHLEGALGILLNSRFELTGAMGDLEEAITWINKAVVADHQTNGFNLANLGSLLWQRHQRSGGRDDLERAILLTERAAEILRDHPNRANWLSNLGVMLCSKHRLTGGIYYLQRAVLAAEEAVKITPASHPSYAGFLSGLVTILSEKYQCFGVAEDLQRAIDLAEKAVSFTPATHPRRAHCVHNLGSLLSVSHIQTNNTETLDIAILKAEEAASALPIDHPNQAYNSYSLGMMLALRYQRTSVVEDLHQAIHKLESSLVVLPVDDTKRPDFLDNLSDKLNMRYDCTGAFEDLEQAIVRAEEAVATRPADHPRQAHSIGNLGRMMWSRYMRTDSMSDLELAICQMEKALDKTPDGDLDRTSVLINLAMVLHWKYSLVGGEDLLRRAIHISRKGIENAGTNSVYLAAGLNNLAYISELSYKQTGEMEHLQEAILANERSLDDTPVDHPHRVLYWNNLGDNLKARYRRTAATSDSNRSLRCYMEGWKCKNGPPRDRITAARKAAKCLVKRSEWREACSLLRGAVELVPLVCSHSLEWEDKQHALMKLSGLGGDALSSALQAGDDAADALRVLEACRGVIIGHGIDGKTDISRLKDSNLELYNRFCQLREEVNGVEDSRSPFKIGESSERWSQQRRTEAMKKLKDTLYCIRRLQGFEGFLLPPGKEEVQKLAEYGPIVVFNPTKIRSDAILITETGIRVLELPRLAVKDLKGRAAVMMSTIVRGSLRTAPTRNRQMQEYLQWLWEVAVGPVCEALGLGKPPASGKLPRVWWICAGVMSGAPIHGAGDHSPESSENTLSRVVSSYTPTFKALMYAREKDAPILDNKNRFLFVTVPETPGKSDLPEVNREVADILELPNFPPSISVTQLDRPCAQEVLTELRGRNFVHFACHGISNPKDPSKSCLFLVKPASPTSPEEVDPLTVRRISSATAQHATLAYLSACCSAENPVAGLADEVLHIASGFQLAGFSHVVATLWESKDSVCVKVSSEFYSLLFGGSGESGESGHARVARALHEAVKGVRDEQWNLPITWAPFIHTGA
ncbi:MAG: hypothetical protein M1813_008917 [Trichoglossum hirsutum]|nr:MAG: hypothetical protein M1813_008917 [Trichoglossum hirsutum]